MYKIDTNFDKNAIETFLFRRNNDNSPTAFRWRSDSKKSISSASTASNILAVNSKNVFYYDGHRFYVIDKTNGAVEFVDSIVQRGPFSTIGIAVDECGNLYLADDSLDISVFNYENKTLKFLQKIQLGTKRLGCFSDIKIDTYKKILYATGDSFVATVSLPISCDLDKDSIIAEITKNCKKELNLKILNLDSSAYYRVTWFEKLNGKIIRDTIGKGIFIDQLNNAKPNMQYLIRISKNPSTIGITDSLYIVNHQESRDTITKKMCAEDTFWLDKQFFLRDTLFQRNYKGYFGCDSIKVFKLNFNPFIRDTIALNFCLGDTFYVANIPYYKNGTYSVKFNASNSCDSIVTYKLKFLYQYGFKVATFCEGDSFSIGKNVYKTSGFYTDTFKSIYGCDSLMYSLLTFLPKSIVSQTKNICEGDSAVVANKKYSISGIYRDTLTAFNTCDSIIHTNVNVFPNNDTTLYIELCNQTSILFNNKLRTSPQVFIDTLDNVNGCDSIITVNLTDKKVKAYFDVDSTNQPSFKFTPNVDASFKGFWDFGMGELDTNLTQQFRRYIDEKDTQYFVCLNVFDSTNCADTFCVNLQITKKTFTVYNSFSPGSDGFNDVYKIKATGGKFKYNIRIYNRWGELVFYQEKANIYDQSKFWNGKVQNDGPECPSGSYFVLFEFFDKGDEKPPTTMHGSISLFRN
jgi:gliding motility-associated-like protein